MRLATLRRRSAGATPGAGGVARLDRRTKDLARRLQPGDVAIIDHVDLDRVSAESLVARQVSAVVNVAPSISGRYPNLGPEILVAAGVPLLDGVGEDVFAAVQEGDVVRIDGEQLLRGDEPVAKGHLQTAETVGALMLEARAGLSTQLEAFASNTMDYLRKERDLIFDGVGVPELRTSLEGRHALIVVRGYDYQEDLASLRPYIREYRPVLIGVDGGADALREAGYKPDLIVGDMDSVTTEALQAGAELVLHAYPDGSAPGEVRLADLGLDHVVFPAAGTSEDIAMLLADERGASLIVAVGSHATLVEFLDRGRAGMASTFLTRLRVGGKLVDAKGVSRLYRSRIRIGSLVLLVVAALVTMLAAMTISPAAGLYGEFIRNDWQDFLHWLGRLMVDFRYHVVSIIAVFLALGTGIVLGSTTLDDVILKDLRGNYEQEHRDRVAVTAKADDLQRRLDHRDDFERAIASTVVRNRLHGERTLVLAAPDADRSVRDDVVRMLQLAGSEVASSPGSTVGGVRLNRKYADPTPAVQAELDDLVTDASVLPSGFSYPDIGSAVDRPAQLLAALLVRPLDGDRPAASLREVTTALSALSSAGVLSVDGPMPLPATMVVVVLPKETATRSPSPGGPESTPWAAELALVRALQDAGRPVLVVSPRLGAGDGTALSAVRKDPVLGKALSTVDNVDTPAGQISVVLALQEQLAGAVGHYGEGTGSDAMVASPTPTPTPSTVP